MKVRVIAAVVVLAVSACAKRPDAAVATQPSAPAPSARVAATSAAAMSTPVTHVVREIANATTYIFAPDTLTIRQGDMVRFEMVSGGPHNVAFDPSTLSNAARAALMAGMPEQVAELSGKFVMTPGETYTISFNDVPPGKYPFVCVPHLAMNQRGVITVVSR